MRAPLPASGGVPPSGSPLGAQRAMSAGPRLEAFSPESVRLDCRPLRGSQAVAWTAARPDGAEAAKACGRETCPATGNRTQTVRRRATDASNVRCLKCQNSILDMPVQIPAKRGSSTTRGDWVGHDWCLQIAPYAIGRRFNARFQCWGQRLWTAPLLASASAENCNFPD